MRRVWVLVFTLLLAVAGFAQTGKTLVVKPSVGPLAGRTVYTNSHALLIGVGRYQHLPADKRLQFADKDALAMREVLIRSYGFATENVTLLLNEEATKQGIENALSEFADPKKVGKDDRLLVYFSGHGQTVTLPDASEMGFLIPHDAKVDLQAPQNAAPYLSTCVEMDGLWKYLRGCSAKHALVLTDACFSGLLVQARTLGEREKLNANELAKQAARQARQVLTAGGKGEEAFEDPKLGHGAFTYKLLEELRAEAAVAGEVFTATDLAATLKRSVSNLTDGKQSPVFGSYRTEGEFLFVTTEPQPVAARARSTRDRATDLAREAEDLLFHGSSGDTRVLALAREALQLQPEHPLARAVLGYALYRSRDLEGAERELREALRIDGKLPLAYAGLGSVYVRQNKLVEAEHALKQCLQLAPRYAPAHNRLGDLYSEQKQYAAAEQAYKQAIQLDSRYAAPHFNLGFLYAEQKQYAAAEQAYKQAIQLDPKDADPHNSLGILYYDQMQYVAAEQAYKQAIQLDSNRATPHYNLGLVYQMLKQYAAAETAYKRAIQLDPKDTQAHNGLGSLQRVLKQYGAAERSYKQAIELEPKYALSYYNLGNVYSDQEQYPAAERAYKQAIEIDPKYAFPHNGLGNVYKALKQYIAAEQSFKQAIQLDPMGAYPHNNLGNLYRAQKQYAAAVKAYEQAIELDPKNALPRNGLGNVYYDQEQYDAAIREYERALQINPDYELARRNLERARKAKAGEK